MGPMVLGMGLNRLLGPKVAPRGSKALALWGHMALWVPVRPHWAALGPVGPSSFQHWPTMVAESRNSS